MTLRAILVAVSVAALATPAFADPFSYTATDTPLAIPPSGTSGITISQIVVTDSGTISDINVFVNLTHTFLPDLDVSLRHDDTGTTVLLHDNSNNSLSSVTFDDEGSPVPVQALSAFDGENILGTWSLIVDDQIGGDTGTLFAFGISGDAAIVPEPSTFALLGLGMLGLGFGAVRRRRKTAAQRTA